VIGIISKDTEIAAVREFFQLFKTPWECYVADRSYDLVITTTGELPIDLDLCPVAIYDSKITRFDGEIKIAVHQGGCLEFEDTQFPLYGDGSAFEAVGRPFLRRKDNGEIVGFELSQGPRRVMRIGYDLFQEVAFLLSQGQPSENAHVPTLELHISLLRSIMVNAGVPFVEVLPAPAGYEFMACLTHDVDFTGIRHHKFDSTMWGFLYRALVGSLVGSLKGTLPWAKCRTNWRAALSLPLVYAGLKDDFWLEFDRYMEIERGLGSTFFFIPFKGHAGTRASRPAPKRRAAKYDVSKIGPQVQELIENGCEVGLHGVDAWKDSAMALVERGRIVEITGQTQVGVRMHWLYFDENSPKVLEETNFSYDSTFGYNEAIGFRAGTSQVFCVAPANALLELPLTIQDTALFYPDRMGLSEAEAMDSCRNLFKQMLRFGGVLTINWHTRSLSPERLWGEFYQGLLAEIQKHRVWFGTAAEVVNWFRARRALRFERVQFTGEELRLKISGPALSERSSFVVRVHHPKPSADASSTRPVPAYSDILWKGEAELTVIQTELSPI
jgi:hypothetical protein